MVERNQWGLPLLMALLGFALPLSMLSILYITAPDSPLLVSNLLALPSVPASMPGFSNGPVSVFFVLAVALCVVCAGLFGASGVVLLGWWFRQARLSSLLAVILGPVVIWVLVFVVPMAHRVIRDYNAGFTRTDLLSYTAVLWTWILAAMIAQVAFNLWARARWSSSPT